MKDGELSPLDPANDDIEEYIRDVKEAAKQLGHGDDAMVNLLKATMPTRTIVGVPIPDHPPKFPLSVL